MRQRGSVYDTKRGKGHRMKSRLLERETAAWPHQNAGVTPYSPKPLHPYIERETKEVGGGGDRYMRIIGNRRTSEGISICYVYVNETDTQPSLIGAVQAGSTRLMSTNDPQILSNPEPTSHFLLVLLLTFGRGMIPIRHFLFGDVRQYRLGLPVKVE
jgi:hypothetical protein